MPHVPRTFAIMLAAAGAWGAPPPASAQTHDEKLSMETLLKAGWQVAGYTSTFDNRSALILLKNPNEMYLVQCLAGYDVQRSPRVYVNCYELH
jgi:hypothetical protein